MILFYSLSLWRVGMLSMVYGIYHLRFHIPCRRSCLVCGKGLFCTLCDEIHQLLGLSLHVLVCSSIVFNLICRGIYGIYIMEVICVPYVTDKHLWVCFSNSFTVSLVDGRRNLFRRFFYLTTLSVAQTIP
jgi:hypothetical protein